MYSWADTERLKEEHEEKVKAQAEQQRRAEEELAKQLEEGIINEAQYKTLVSVETQHAEARSMRPSPRSLEKIIHIMKLIL